MWSLFKGNGSDGEPGSYWEFLLGCGSFSCKQLSRLDTKGITACQVSCFMAHFRKKNKKNSYTLIYIFAAMGGCPWNFKTHIFMSCAFMELCGKWILFDKLNPTCSYNNILLLELVSVTGCFKGFSPIGCFRHPLCIILLFRSGILPVPLCLNDRSWHSHWFCGLLFQYLQPFTCCNKVNFSFFDGMCFLCVCSEPVVAFVALYSSLSLSRCKAKSQQFNWLLYRL